MTDFVLDMKLFPKQILFNWEIYTYSWIPRSSLNSILMKAFSLNCWTHQITIIMILHCLLTFSCWLFWWWFSSLTWCHSQAQAVAHRDEKSNTLILNCCRRFANVSFWWKTSSSRTVPTTPKSTEVSTSLLEQRKVQKSVRGHGP